MNKISLQVPSEAGDTVEGLEQVAQTDENTETDNTSDINQPEGGEEMAGIDNADEAAQDGPAQIPLEDRALTLSCRVWKRH